MFRVIIRSFVLKNCEEREVSRSERSLPGVLDAIDRGKVCYGIESNFIMVAHNVCVRACAIKRAEKRCCDDALRV